MSSVKYFEDFKIWQDARKLVKEVYTYTNYIKDYGFNDQIQRAAISIMNNIAEGAESGSDSMFKKFLQIAKGSCGEVRSMLYAAMDLKYIDEESVNQLLPECQQLSASIAKLANYLK